MVRQVSSEASADLDPAFEVDFEVGDRGNPQNWSSWYKCLVIGVMSYATTCVVLYSTSYTSAIPGIVDTLGASNIEGVLGLTTYLLGVAAGSVILAPLSEMYGRRPVYVLSLVAFCLFLLPSALAQNIETVLVSRFFAAFFAAGMYLCIHGLFSRFCDLLP